ncbi:ammonium Transporter Family [Nitratireductor indicus C115]|uniref:Ammonium transporter n=1 Tax=Nitratireductor indicus C115 TaxID=1231190 RepID=K2NZQ2_9HYPH|nr:ammonium transporter [Nitratireductor indicus]EKF40536.1 ammonium Transporter Family [Nitratireductor indicus C115]SFQ49435.1 ammonium transporter, Amt family [Nitratireductor indicus]
MNYRILTSAARPLALGGLALAALTFPALAQETAEAAPEFATAADTAFIFNTLLFLIGGFLVMWMAAGFAMLEAGMVRTKNVSMQLLKNVVLYAIAGIMYWLIGYGLMYVDVSGYIGSFTSYSWPAAGTANEGDYSVASDWFFQMVFVATAASIVSGTLAERIKLWPFLAFVVVLTGFIYPIAGSWKWGGGWLDAMGFQDFAGSTLVHSVGGWAALAGAILLGARNGKFNSDGKVNPIPGSNMALATLGTFILWLGWFGFNGASQLAMGSNSDVSDISRIFANTNLAAAGGVVAALILTQILYKKVDITFVLNGALAGLVSITAEPLTPSPLMAIIIGAIGGIIVVFAVPMLDKLKIDDVVGAIPVHLIAGIWGTLAVPLTNSDASFGVQFIGIVAYAVFTLVASLIVWAILKATIGLRVSAEDEMNGLDLAEVGVEAYPEFIAVHGR